MDGYIISIYSGFWVVGRSATHPIATHQFAFSAVAGQSGNTIETAGSCYLDVRVHSRRIKVSINVFDYMADIARCFTRDHH